MRSCPNGHVMDDSATFCHTCGAQAESAELSVAPTPSEQLPAGPRPHSNASLYVSIVSAVVIVLGLAAIAWVVNDNGSTRQAAEPEASISLCGYRPTQRPVGITLSCDTGASALIDLTWSQWGAKSATGVGTYVYKSCQPTCNAPGAPTIAQATVILSGVTTTAAGPQFTTITVTPKGARPFSQQIAAFNPATAGTISEPSGPPVPSGGVLCPPLAGAGPHGRLGVIGKFTSCEFADQVFLSYLGSGGHGQSMRVIATSAVTHQTYRNIACTGGVYVICVGGEHDTAKLFFGPFQR